MKCPMLISYPDLVVENPITKERISEPGRLAAFQDCIGEECAWWAWWDEEKNCCSIKLIAKESSRIRCRIRLKT